MINATELFKKSVIEGLNAGEFSATSILVTLGASLLFGLYIYAVYFFMSKRSFYNKGFNKTLAVLPMITAAILIAMQSNLIVSLGMVGALSIVRFRNAVKESEDLMFLFWSITTGIIIGTNLLKLAIILAILVTVIVVLLDLLPSVKAPGLLIVSAEGAESEKDILTCVKKYAKRSNTRSRNLTKQGLELVIEVKTGKDSELCNEINQIAGIVSVNMISHDGNLRC